MKGRKNAKNILTAVPFVYMCDILLVVTAYVSVCLLCKYGFDEAYNLSLAVHVVSVSVFLFGFEMYRDVTRKKYDVMLSVLLVVFFSTVVSEVIMYVLIKRFNRSMFLDAAIEWTLITVWRILREILIIKIRGGRNLLVITASGIDNSVAKKIKYSCMRFFKSWYTDIDVNDSAAVDEFIKGEFSNYGAIFITPSIPDEVKKKLVSEAVVSEKEIYVLPNLYDINLTKCDMFQFDDSPAFRIKLFTLTKGQQIIKRAFDLIVSGIGIIIASPFMAIAALAIKLDSKGPVFYTQTRVTKGQKEFKIYKFRTMVDNAEKITGPVISAGEDDSRITRVGKILRMTRIDELPQLINIFKGEMSLVGPRPERPVFVEKFCEEIEDYDKRYAVKAGLTGYAQIYGRYDTTAGDKLLYDLLYIREYSFFLDVKVLLMTVKTIFDRESAEGINDEYRAKDKPTGN